MGVPEDGEGPSKSETTAAWRLQTVRAKHLPEPWHCSQKTHAKTDAARAENAHWRRMAIDRDKDGFTPRSPQISSPPPHSPEASVSRQSSRGSSFDMGPPHIPLGPEPRELLAEIAADPDASWAVATAEAKEGNVEAARRENMAWRLMNLRTDDASS